MDKIIIKGAREHNLKNIDLEIPRDKLVVISGLSGSGKSSLAFDTIYAEGQRRYVESLSSYARQFLGRMDKPDVDYIEGLSPAISIEQKTTHKNPRSTVGTVTEIYDYLRLLYARIGKPHCPKCNREIREQSKDQIFDAIITFPENTKIIILAPVISNKKGEHEKIIADAKKSGFVRARIDGDVINLDEIKKLEKTKKHTIEIVIDRIVVSKENRKRISESIESAIETGDERIIVLNLDDNSEHYFSMKNSCPDCNISIAELQPALFSFNNPIGACPACSGLGITLEFDPDLIVPDKSLSYNEGAFIPYKPTSNWHRSRFEALAKKYKFSLDTPVEKLDKKFINILFYGSEDDLNIKYVNSDKNHRFEYNTKFQGIISDMKRRYKESISSNIKEWFETFMKQKECETCHGQRLKDESLGVTVAGKNIFRLTTFSVGEISSFFKNLKLSKTEEKISWQIIKEIKARLEFLVNVGLDYLTLERKAATLSGGEAQRIRLATQIGSSLVGVLYILDEPTIGLHQRDNNRLIDTLKHLRDIKNTVIVVEHDEQTIRSADYVIELGPAAGVHGGNLVATGSPLDIINNKKSITGRFLSGIDKIENRDLRREGNGKKLVLKGAREHNLKKINVEFPLGKMIAITGVSGSGKSTLVNDILYPAIFNKINRSAKDMGKFDKLEGTEFLDKVINIDQSPIGRTPRSNPATYVELFTPIRDLFANLPDSKARGYKPGRFSFNVKGGRCENCEGDGTIRIEMHFLPDVYITCDVCNGKRFNRDTLEIRYKGKNIYEILEMTVEDALEFFSSIPVIKRKLTALSEVGLGYIKLGQSALTLSGGEAQRVKLAHELSKVNTGNTLYLLDEPTTGLHFGDVRQLLNVLNTICDKGNTIIIIEHNMDIIKSSDYIIDLGPEGGNGGGEVIFSGVPEDIINSKSSYTGKYLKDYL
ncbi:MAG: excinuclease ABC subunit UvrA [Spirochaetaceae bacterium]|nr:excinuclease ABC subunit UvrA [Spirochaetaceae bacterium]